MKLFKKSKHLILKKVSQPFIFGFQKIINTLFLFRSFFPVKKKNRKFAVIALLILSFTFSGMVFDAYTESKVTGQDVKEIALGKVSVGISSAYGISSAHAGGWVASAFSNALQGLIFGIAQAALLVINTFLGSLVLLELWVLGFIAGYNNFIYVAPVTIGWAAVRDIANTAIIAIMIIIGFSTILNVQTFSYKQLLPKLLVAAILVNFSKMICGIFIDISQVILLSFFGAVESIFNGGFLEIIGLNKILGFAKNPLKGDADVVLKIVIAQFAAMIFMLVVAVVMLFYMVVFLIRMVMLWLLIVLSPMVFVLPLIPQGQGYAGQWWKEFTNYLILGPMLAFFLWLSFVSIGTVQEQMKADPKIKKAGDPIKAEKLIIAVMEPANFLSFVIAIGMLLGGLQLSQSIAGAASGVVGLAGKAAKGAAIGGAILGGGVIGGSVYGAGKLIGKIPLGKGRTLAGATTAVGKAAGWATGITPVAKIAKWGAGRLGETAIGKTAYKMSGMEGAVSKMEEKFGGFTASGKEREREKRISEMDKKMTGTEKTKELKRLEDKGGPTTEKEALFVQMMAKSGEEMKKDVADKALAIAGKDPDHRDAMTSALFKGGGDGMEVAALSKDRVKYGDNVVGSDNQGFLVNKDGGRVSETGDPIKEGEEGVQSLLVKGLSAGKIDSSKIPRDNKHLMHQMKAAFGDDFGRVLERDAKSPEQKKEALDTLKEVMKDDGKGGVGLVDEYGDLNGSAKAVLAMGGTLGDLGGYSDSNEARELAASSMTNQQITKSLKASQEMTAGVDAGVDKESIERAIAAGIDKRNMPKTANEATKVLKLIAKFEGKEALKRFQDDPRFKFSAQANEVAKGDSTFDKDSRPKFVEKFNNSLGNEQKSKIVVENKETGTVAFEVKKGKDNSTVLKANRGRDSAVSDFNTTKSVLDSLASKKDSDLKVSADMKKIVQEYREIGAKLKSSEGREKEKTVGERVLIKGKRKQIVEKAKKQMGKEFDYKIEKKNQS